MKLKYLNLSFTNIVILINIFMYLLTLFAPEYKQILALSFYSLFNYIGFITYAFIHGDLQHIAFNMAMFYAFGNQIEYKLGVFKIAILYFSSIVVVGVVSFLIMFCKVYFFDLSPYIMLGASGSVCALLGFACNANKVYFREYFTAVLIMSFLPLLMGVNVAYDAHIVGFLFGYFLSFIKFFKIKNIML